MKNHLAELSLQAQPEHALEKAAEQIICIYGEWEAVNFQKWQDVKKVSFVLGIIPTAGSSLQLNPNSSHEANTNFMGAGLQTPDRSIQGQALLPQTLTLEFF